MAAQTFFENLIIGNSDSCYISEKRSSLKIVQSHLHDSFRKIVTQKEVKNLAKHISPDAELVDYNLRPYSEEKIGFLGTHLCLDILIKRLESNDCEKRSFFVKTIPYDVPIQAAYINEKGLFRKEAGFFRHIVPLLMENYNGDSWTPKCYLAKENVLVFEDMKSRGFFNKPRLFDEDTAKSAVACIARFHACSLLAEERLNGKSLNELYSEFLQESEFKRTGRSYIWYTNAIDLAVSIAEDLQLNSSYIRQASERVFDAGKPSINKRNVISHGDLWSSNMLFDGTDHCNLVDFQLVRYAPLAHDFMQLIYLSTSREFRATHERELVYHYYATLQESLAVNGYEGIVPSCEEVMQGVEEQRLMALVTAVIFHPTVLMDGKTAAGIMNDPVTYEAYYFNDRRPFVNEIMARDAAYERRIKEVVKELAEMSLILDSLPRPT